MVKMLKFGVSFVSDEGFEKIVEYSVRAEKADLDYVFMSEHLKGGSIFVYLTAVAINTEKVSLGPGITNPYLNHPISTGQMLASLDEISKGRVVCGIGAGDKENLRKIGVNQYKPVSAVREAVEILRTVSSGQTVNINGEVFRISNARLRFFMTRKYPVFIGAQGDKMLGLAGIIGDGVIINAGDAQECKRAIEIARFAGEHAKRSMSDFVWSAATPFSISEDEDDAIKPLLPKVAVVVGGCNKQVLDRYGISIEEAQNVREALKIGDYSKIAKSVTPNMIESLSIAGTPDNCIEKISALVKAGIKLVILSPPLGRDISHSLDLIENKVMPHFR